MSVVNEFIQSLTHYRQEDDNMCAQHCLNALVQNPHFDPVTLAEIAMQLDRQEKEQYLEAGMDSPEYLAAMQADSQNMDDSGFFSIQVITKALGTFNLNLLPISSKDAGNAFSQPEKERAFICHFQHHWFTIRKFGEQWVNLNSYLKRPSLHSDTYLSIYLTQLVQEGYSIFVVKGELPYCIGDQLATAYGLHSISDDGGEIQHSVDREEMRQIEEAILQSMQTSSQHSSK